MRLREILATSEASLEAVMSWTDATTIYNTECAALKQRLARDFDKEWDRHPPFPRDAQERRKIDTATLDLCEALRFGEFGCRNLAGLHKSRALSLLSAATVESTHEIALRDHYTACLRKWIPVSAKLAIIKASAIAGRRPSERATAAERYRAEIASTEAYRLIEESCAEATIDWRKHAGARFERLLRGYSAKYFAERREGETPSEFWKRAHRLDELRQARVVGDQQQRRTANAQLCAAEEATAYADGVTRDTMRDSDFPRRKAEQEVDVIVTEFTRKMQMKLGFLDRRLASIEAFHVRSSGGILECDLRVTMTNPDGARFLVRNQIVTSTSIYGREFARYPSTFHDIEIPGRPRRASASEREMNALFPRRLVERQIEVRAEECVEPVLVTPAVRRAGWPKM